MNEDAICKGEIGDDAVVRIINDQVALVENVDVFTPIHDDPHTQGEIVACNATNDVFAMGATGILSLQAVIGYPKGMDEEIVVGVLKGMNDFMMQFGSRVAGGQTITNPIPIFGGICLGVAHPDDIVYSRGAHPGDAILLTKPLGIQAAMRSYRDLQDDNRDALLDSFDESELRKMQETAVRVMTYSNRVVALAMKRVGVSAATDVTGFGLIGHADNVATQSGVDVVIEEVPVIKGTLELSRFFGHKLDQGLAAETAGGMLVFLQPDRVEDFQDVMKQHDLPCWPIGRTEKPMGTPEARLTDGVKFVETEFP